MVFSCFKKPAVQDDFGPAAGAAPASGNGLAGISPLPAEGRLNSSPRSSFGGSRRRTSRDGAIPSLEKLESLRSLREGHAWYEVDNPLKWTGPPVPTTGPSEAEEPFMTAQPKKEFKGCPMMPWEGENWSGPQMLQIIHAGLKDFKQDAKQGRPDTHKLSLEEQMVHMRRACADILPTPLFSFMLKWFEGPDTELGQACDRFLTRILAGCKNTVYCSIAHPIPQVRTKKRSLL